MRLLEDAREDRSRANGQVCMAKTMIAEYHAAIGELEKSKTLLAQRPECGPPPKAG